MTFSFNYADDRSFTLDATIETQSACGRHRTETPLSYSPVSITTLAKLANEQNKDRPMINVPQPSMVLNAPDAPSRYVMRATYDVQPTEDVDVFLRQVRQAALRQPEKTLRYLVINCHGLYNGSSREATGGYGLKIGRGIRCLTAHHFSLLRESNAGSRGLVNHILITACGAAAVSPLNSEGDGNGELLCKNIAWYSGAYVSASNIIQISMAGQATPYQISSFEGLRQTFAPDGHLAAQEWNSRWFLQTLFHGPN